MYAYASFRGNENPFDDLPKNPALFFSSSHHLHNLKYYDNMIYDVIRGTLPDNYSLYMRLRTRYSGNNFEESRDSELFFDECVCVCDIKKLFQRN